MNVAEFKSDADGGQPMILIKVFIGVSNNLSNLQQPIAFSGGDGDIQLVHRLIDCAGFLKIVFQDISDIAGKLSLAVQPFRLCDSPL